MKVLGKWSAVTFRLGFLTHPVNRLTDAMDVSLKVLAGAKVGAKVAIRKSEFVIGRSDQCHLSVGTTSVSRQHCKISRGDTAVTVQDLGSRNGTYVNGEKIEGQRELTPGDELGVGPLLFQVRISSGISNAKQPKVESVADAVARTASQDSDIGDDDISSWLVGPNAQGEPNETQTIQFNESKLLKSETTANEQSDAETVVDDPGREGRTADETDIEQSDSEADDENLAEDDSSAKKKGPGKLPFRPEQPQTKDSREAAAMALRNWSRRR